ncbi:hypothetical protein [Chroococcidiopsis sp. SAG 2025]|nr:hypothetical protein [Chroococcidiopsis sp. SAG 2025]
MVRNVLVLLGSREQGAGSRGRKSLFITHHSPLTTHHSLTHTPSFN